MWTSVVTSEVGDTCLSPPKYCVDFRKFFCPAGTDEIKPTRSGVALRLHDWWKFVEIIKSIDDAYPALATAVPCNTGDERIRRRCQRRRLYRLCKHDAVRKGQDNSGRRHQSGCGFSDRTEQSVSCTICFRKWTFLSTALSSPPPQTPIRIAP